MKRLVVAAALIAAACDKSASNTSEGPAPGPASPEAAKAGDIGGGTNPQGPAPAVAPENAALAASSTMTVDVLTVGVIGLDTGAGLHLTTVDPLVGESGAGDLESIKYYFTGLTICKDLTVKGTGYSNPKGCLEIFRLSDEGYDSFDIAKAEADFAANPGHWVDLMKKGDMKAKLFPAGKEFKLMTGEQKIADFKKRKAAGTLSPEELEHADDMPAEGHLPEGDEGEYKFAVINWMKPIRLKAKVKMGSKTLYTRTGTLKTDTVGVDNFKHNYIEAADLSTPNAAGGADEITFMHNNGGSWFKFSKPLVITKEDLAAKRAYELNLVFNPEGLIKATTDRGRIGGTSVVVADAAGNGLISPFLSLTPLLAAKGDLQREAYRGKFAGNANVGPYDLTIDLYYLASDASKAIIGVGNTVHVTADSTDKSQTNWYPLFGAVQRMDGKLDLRSHRDVTIKGMTRLATKGATAQLEACESLYINVPEEQPVPDPACTYVSVPYELVESGVVNP